MGVDRIVFGDERLPERYWSKIQIQESGCWEWVGARGSAQYGQLRLNGKALLAHRMMCEVAYGAPEPGMYGMHICDNPPCVNPEHLRWGTPSENSQDAIRKGRKTYPKLQKTQCPQGHVYSDENSYYTKSGTRACRECYRGHWRKWNLRRTDPSYVSPRTPRHGTVTEYGWGCRCSPCREAKAEAHIRYRESKKK